MRCAAKHECCRCSRNTASTYEFAEYLPISAATGEGLDELRAQVISRLPEGPEYFPPDHFTDQPARFLAAELIREKILQATRQEVPHSVTRHRRKMGRAAASRPHLRHHPGRGRRPEGHRDRRERRHAETDRHAGARGDGGALRHSQSYLDLHVKVEAGWREKAAFLKHSTGVQ